MHVGIFKAYPVGRAEQALTNVAHSLWHLGKPLHLPEPHVPTGPMAIVMIATLRAASTSLMCLPALWILKTIQKQEMKHFIMLSLLFLPTAPKLPLTLHPSRDRFLPSSFYKIACFLLFFPIYSATVCSTETPLTRLTSDKVTLNCHLTRSASDTGKHILILRHVLNTVMPVVYQSQQLRAD